MDADHPLANVTAHTLEVIFQQVETATADQLRRRLEITTIIYAFVEKRFRETVPRGVRRVGGGATPMTDAVQVERDAILQLVDALEAFLVQQAQSYAGTTLTVTMDMALGTAAYKVHELREQIAARETA